MVAPLKGLVALGILIFFKYSVGDGKWCTSPQYIELAKEGTILCSLRGVYAISWYNSTILRNEYPIIHYKHFRKSGSGYESGEFDIYPNGSLIITNVSLKHDHYFAVEYLQSESSVSVVINVDVIVIVKPQLSFPAVDACENVSKLCFRNIDKDNLSCSVELARPNVHLRWTTKTVFGDKNISFHQQSESNGHLFTSRVSTTDAFKYTSRLALAACTAHTLPEMLESNEYLILLQNSNQSILNAEPVVRYVERYSRIELPCAENSIGFLAWWEVDLPSRRFSHPLLYAVLMGNLRNEILEKGYEMGGDGSLIVPQVDIANNGMYSCIFGNGVSDGTTLYEIILYVNPIPNYPVIEGCNHDKYCVLDVEDEGNLTCSVYGIRPKVQLHWMAFKKQESISFKPQNISVEERMGTFDISLTSAYHSNFRAGDRITLVCKVTSPDVALFDMATTIDLIFSEVLQVTTIEATVRNNLSPPKKLATTIIVIVAVVLVIGAAFIYKVIRQKLRQSTSEIINEERHEMLPSQPSKNKDTEELMIYLQERNEHLCEALDKIKNNEHKEVEEILRKVCFMGVEISGDEKLQKSAIYLLNIATKKGVYIKSVILRGCFGSVDRKASVITTTLNQRLTSKTNFTQLNIDFRNKSLRTADLQDVKRLFGFASKCPRLRTLKFTNCVLPLQFDDISVFKDLSKNNVEVYWENSVLIPKYRLNLSNGQWEDDADGSQLNENDYNHVMAFLSEETYIPGYLQILKGSRNYSPRQMVLAEGIFQTMERFFKLHGAETIDTPLFELKETFVQNFEPEYSRLMYYLNDQGNESVSLRFDLTIPFVRYIEINNVTNMKRYHIGKVYRREGSVMKGRRCGEFYQCDFDIAGKYDRMVPDAECIQIICTVLKELNVGEFIVKVNHHKVLHGLSKLLDVPKDDIVKLSDLIDHEPHISTTDISRIFNDKQLSYEEAKLAKLQEYLKIKGGKDQIETLLQDGNLLSTEEAKEGLRDLELLFQFCDDLGIVEQVQFEMDLTRSLGYYTGLVFEAVLKVPRQRMDKNFKAKGILANGGRFDNLVSKLTRNRSTVPCVGFTFDCEQLFTLLEIKEEIKKLPTRATEVLVTSDNPHMAREILKLCKQLWDAGVKTEIAHKSHKIITDADKKSIAVKVSFEKEETDRVAIVTTSLGTKEYVGRSEVVSIVKQRLLNWKEQKMAAERNEKPRKK
ncbi:Histidine--tRNA ligase, cytoplasmic [Holothuria leucospilota]|uniref:Histidine--tRNA ligase, cytoplasmic n=1 Tax=Holothuria leucospilota TaxID=206669 RepID=A0A9Q1CT72_HOLLE|nr:Histidine--tRNA ligase, cytoplasmic [Holothuria leucospilota]